MKAWVYPLTTDPADGRVAVIVGASDEATAQAAVPPGRTAVYVDLPAERTFRNAWTSSGTRVTVDMPTARVIHLDRIRRVRNTRLNVLDKDWMRAVGQGDTVGAATIEAQRQALRDLPQTFDLTTAATPEELMARWPSQLPQP